MQAMKKIFGYLLLFLLVAPMDCLLAQDSISRNIPPPIYITRVRIADKDTSVQDLYELKYGANKIIIDFSTDLTLSPEKIYYKYQLSRIDNNWVGTEYPSVQYTNLAPGEYTFSVSAINDHGVWSEQPANIHFIIYPPFWQSWWFKLIIFDILVLTLMLFEHLRFKRAMRKEQKKNELERKTAELELIALRAQMNPHFIFNALNSIQRYITDNDKKLANKYLVDFSKLIRRIIENSQAKTIPVAEEMDTLHLYLQLETLRMGESKMEYEIYVDPQIDIYNEEIPPLLIQPYAENAIWHGISHLPGKGKIKIELKKDNNYIICSVTDNGIGRTVAEKLKSVHDEVHKPRGMAFTKERLEILNSLLDMSEQSDSNTKSVEIIDLYDANKNPTGTEVRIYIPVEKN